MISRSIFSFFRKRGPSSIIFFILLLALIPLAELFNQIHRKDYFQAFVIFVWFTAVLVFPVFIFRKNLKLYLALLIPVYLVVPINLLYVWSFNSELSADIMLLVFNTNRYEAMELLHNYWVGLVAIYLVYIAAIVLLWRKCPTVIPPKLAYSLAAVCLVIIVIFPTLDIKYTTRTIYETARANISDKFPVNILKGIKRHREEMQMVGEMEKYRQNFHFQAKRDSSIQGKQVIVLIIGESSRYDHWGINGYNRNTSPRLAKRQNLLNFSNVASGSHVTELAVPLLLSGVGAENFADHVRKKNILGLFNEVGYNTYWISDQAKGLGFIEVHTRQAQHQYHKMGDQRRDKDMYLLDSLNKVLKQPGDRKFIVIHTMGSHYDYAERYPDEFDIYKPSYKTFSARVSDIKHKNVLINSYDNSIVYSDAVIDSVINMVNKLNNFSSVLYLSDHGENLLDDNRRLNFHNTGNPASQYQLHIPLFLWYSPQLQQKYPDKIANLASHKNAAISSQSLIYTLSSLAGISYPAQDASKNIASPFFKDSKQYVLGDEEKVYSYPYIKKADELYK